MTSHEQDPGDAIPAGSGRLHLLAIIGLLLVYAVLLFAFLDSDPPRNLDRSDGIYSDEGYKTYSARNVCLFGRHKLQTEETDGWYYDSPVATWSWIVAFRWCGVSFRVARTVSALLGWMTALLAYLVVNEVAGRRAALIALFLYILDYNLVMFHRLAILVSHVGFFALLSVWTWQLGLRGQSWCSALSGASLFAAYLCKMSAALIAPAFAVEVMAAAVMALRERDRAVRWRSAIASMWFLAGLVTTIGIWIVLGESRPLEEVGSSHSVAASFARPAGHLWEALVSVATLFEESYYNKFPLVLVAGVLAMLWMLFDRGRTHAGWRRGGRLLVVWMLVALVFHSLNRYRAARWLCQMSPPIILLGGILVAHRSSQIHRSICAWGRVEWAIAFCAALWTSYGLVFMALNYVPHLRFSQIGASLLAGLPLGVIVFTALRRWSVPAPSLPGTQAQGFADTSLASGAVARLVLVGSTCIFAAYYLGWHLDRTTLARDASCWLRDHVPRDGTTLVGTLSPTLGLENTIRFATPPDTGGSSLDLSERIRTFQASHFLASPQEVELLPEPLRRRARHLTALPLKHGVIHVYSLVPSAD